MTIATFTTLRLVKHFHRHKLSLLMTGNDHLGDTLTIFHYKILLRKIDQHNTYLTTVVGINGTRRIQYCDTFLQCQTTTGAHLGLITYRQSNVQTRRNQSAL